MKIIFIVPASKIGRNRLYRIGGSFYGRSNSITGPLILEKILKNTGHNVEVYEKLYKDLGFQKMIYADVKKKMVISIVSLFVPDAKDSIGLITEHIEPIF